MAKVTILWFYNTSDSFSNKLFQSNFSTCLLKQICIKISFKLVLFTPFYISIDDLCICSFIENIKALITKINN